MRNLPVHAALLGLGIGLGFGWPAPAGAGMPHGGAFGDPFAAKPSLLVPSGRLDLAATAGELNGGAAAPALDVTGTRRRRYIFPVLLSAAVPGLGEIATGHWWRGLPLVAADVATWWGRAHYLEEGRAWRTQYEAYADAHWLYTGDRNANGVIDAGETPGWQENLHDYYDGQSGPTLDWWDPESDYNCTCPYIPKEADRQHYYENVGKYRYYWMGWDDWAYNTADPTNSDSERHRREYGLMRIESNENFDHASSMIVVAMATRLASVVQSVFLVRGDLRHEPQLGMRVRKLRGRGTGIELVYRY